MDIRAREHDLHLIAFSSRHQDAAIVQRAGNDIRSFLRDGDGGAFHHRPIAIYKNAVAGKLDIHGGSRIVRPIPVPVGKFPVRCFGA